MMQVFFENRPGNNFLRDLEGPQNQTYKTLKYIFAGFLLIYLRVHVIFADWAN